MNKEEMVNKMAKKAGISKSQAQAALDAFCSAVAVTLRNGEKVSLVGFGSFEAKHRKARDYKSPQTGETVHLEDRYVPSFKPGKILKDALAK